MIRKLERYTQKGEKMPYLAWGGGGGQGGLCVKERRYNTDQKKKEVLTIGLYKCQKRILKE